MKKMIAIVLAGYLVIGLLACGAKEVSDDGAGAATEAVQSTSLTEDRGDETQTDSQFNEVLSSYNGAYSDGTNYLVISNNGITVNGQKVR